VACPEPRKTRFVNPEGNFPTAEEVRIRGNRQFTLFEQRTRERGEGEHGLVVTAEKFSRVLDFISAVRVGRKRLARKVWGAPKQGWGKEA